MTFVFFANKSPSVITRLPAMPGAILPSRSLRPTSAAGVVSDVLSRSHALTALYPLSSLQLPGKVLTSTFDGLADCIPLKRCCAIE